MQHKLNTVQTVTNFKKSLQRERKQIKKKHNSLEPEGKVGSRKAAWAISM
jgi:hypothetical protein